MESYAKVTEGVLELIRGKEKKKEEEEKKKSKLSMSQSM